MGRKRKPPTAVIRLPVDVIEALKRRAKKEQTDVGSMLREALHLPTPPDPEESA